MSIVTEQDVSRLVSQLSDEQMKTLSLRRKLQVVKAALVEVQDHLYTAQDMSRCRALVIAALAEIRKEP